MPTSLTLKNSFWLSPEAKAWIITLGSLVPICWLLIHGYFSLLAFFMVLVALLIPIISDKQSAVCVILVYLFLLGDIRRGLGTFIGFPKVDPLLLVGPIVTILLALPILLKLRLRDSISRAMLGLMAIMTLEIVNPRQGGITVGLAGAMFYLLPMFWFWIGRRYGTHALLERVLYKIVIPIAVIAAFMGLYQTYGGFLPWQKAWIDAVGSHYHALSLGGGFIRAFGFSVNSLEYANILLIGSTVVVAAFFGGRRVYGLLFPLLGGMLFLASSRTSIVKLIFAIAVAWALSSKGGKGWAVRLPIGLAVLVGLLALGLSRAGGGDSSAASSSAAGFSTQHQVEGLAHPLDKKHSTAGLHAAYFLGGFKAAFAYPIGYGLGSVTMGSKFGDGDTGGGSSDDDVHVGQTEVDISDSFVSMGLPGGLLYLYIVYLVVRRSIAFGRNAPKYLGLPTLALLAAVSGGWMALGQYAIGPLVWFVIGSLVRDSDPVVSRPRAALIGVGQLSRP
jgi:hypothetical protein